MSALPQVHLRRTKRILEGHLWVFSNEIKENVKNFEPGSIVEVYDTKDSLIGIGYINPHSLIAIRFLTRDKEPVNKNFFRKRVQDALNYRESFLNKSDAMRLVFSEGDFLPGLIVDKYKNCLVIQFLTLGMETFKDMIIQLLAEMLSPEVIVVRNDSRIRSLEGIPLYKEIVKGDLTNLPVIEEDGLLFEVDPYEGQKTGFFLDQRENRIALKHFIKGGKGLDLFCYTGAWAIGLASKGADITGVDDSERAIKMAQRNAELNNLLTNLNFVKSDVFTFLQNGVEKGEGRYDFIVLDPPAFVKSASKIKEAVRAYRELNVQCMKLLRKGGILATSSCSYHMNRELFLEMLRNAGKDAGKRLRLLRFGSQALDHPILLSMPETEYLKCAFLVVE